MDDQTPEGDVTDESRKDYSQGDRDKMAKSGAALPDGSFPIANEADLKNAIQAYGRAKNQAAAKAHIIKRAKALGLTSLLPDAWEQNAAEPDLEVRRAFAESMKGSREQREFTVTGMECRALDDGTLRMAGYASLTEDPYEIGAGERGFTETIKRGAFRRTLAENPDTVLLINHDGIPLAGTRNGSLALSEDARGLRWTADLDAEDPDSRMLARKVDAGLLDQCSFAFVCTDDEWDDDFKERSIKSLSLHRGDVSVVTNGANPNTTVGLRSMIDDLVEARSGKTLSKKTRKDLQGLQDALTAILDKNDAPKEPVMDAEPADEAVDPVDPADSVTDDLVDAAEAVLTGTRDAEPVEKAAVFIPDYTTRARQKLTLIQRRMRS